MRSLEVVVLDEELDAPKTVRKVRKHRLAQKLLPQRLPEAFDLAERLGMLRPALAVLDAIAPEQLLKLGFASPCGVLAALVGQHLVRLAVLGDAALERFDHQARLLVMRHRPRHQVARVVVHEADEVHALMATQLEGEEVALPELVWFRTLEAALRLVTRRSRRLLLRQTLFVENPAHRRLRHAQCFEASKDVSNLPRTELGVGLLERDDRRVLRTLLALLAAVHLRFRRCQAQRLQSATAKQRHELLHARGRQTKRDCCVSVGCTAHHRLHDPDAYVVRHRSAPLGHRRRPACSFLVRHLFHSSASAVSRSRTTGAMRTSAHETTH